MIKGYKFPIALIFSIIGVLSPFLFLPFSLHWADEPYQMMNAMDYLNNPVAVLSSYFLYLCGDNFGWELLNLRIFESIISSITILISVLYYYVRTKKLISSLYMLGGCSLLLSMN